MRPLLPLAVLAVTAACASDNFETVSVLPLAETADMAAAGDTADDPAVWVHAYDAPASIVLGTNKDEGLFAYALDGSLAEALPIGRLNNVDLRILEDGEHDLAVASNRSINAISVFTIDKTSGALTHARDILTGKDEPYGICLGLPRRSPPLVAVTYKDGTIEFWALTQLDGELTGVLTRRETLRSQPEGCVFDEHHGRIYVGEEGRGIWSVDLEDETLGAQPVDMISDRNGLAGDVEGLTLWRGADGAGWLVASAQGADRFVVYDRAPPNAPRGVFSIADNAAAGIDGVSHTDGLDVVSAPLPGFPRGLLVVQDDANPVETAPQNFKLVSWADVEAALGLPQLPPE